MQLTVEIDDKLYEAATRDLPAGIDDSTLFTQVLETYIRIRQAKLEALAADPPRPAMDLSAPERAKADDESA